MLVYFEELYQLCLNIALGLHLTRYSHQLNIIQILWSIVFQIMLWSDYNFKWSSMKVEMANKWRNYLEMLIKIRIWRIYKKIKILLIMKERKLILIFNDNINNYPISVDYCEDTNSVVNWRASVKSKLFNYKEYGLSAENYIVNRNKEKLDCVADTSHDGEPDSARCGNFLELCDVWLFADFQESNAIITKLL